MQEFHCGSPVCTSHFTAATRADLRREIHKHVQTVHRIPLPTRSILDYLEQTAVHDVPPAKG